MSHNFRIRDRALEWHLAAFSAIFGVWVGSPETAFAAPNLQVALRLFPESVWAMLFAGVGMLHLVALGINGAAWWTPFVRVLAASLNLFFFAVFTAAVWEYDHRAAVVAVYSGAVVAPLVTIVFKALRDCFLMKRAWNVERT